MSAELTEADVREFIQKNGGKSPAAVLGAMNRYRDVLPTEENRALAARVLDESEPEGGEGDRPDGETDAESDDETDASAAPSSEPPFDSETDFEEINETDRASVRITQDVGEILGVDGRDYDLRAGDVLELPTVNAEPLIRKEAAERVGGDSSENETQSNPDTQSLERETDAADSGGKTGETPSGGVWKRHYARDGLVEMYRALGRSGGDEMVATRGKVEWFRETADYLDLDVGDSAEARVYGLGSDAPRFLHRAATERMNDRALYGTTNYVSREWLSDSWAEFTRTDDGRVWETEDGTSPTHPYAQIERFGLFVDIDLEDEAKAARYGEGDAEAYDQETVETAIRFVVAHFARLLGGREHVLVLDSGGGVYVMVPPGATKPLLEAFGVGEVGREAVVKELGGAMNEWLAGVEQGLHRAIPATRGMLKFDKVNHKNRAFKAPLSLHSTYDAVVRPLDLAAPDYSPLHPDDVTDADVEAAREWAEAFAAEGYAEAAEPLAEELLEAHPEEWSEDRVTANGRIRGDADLSPTSRTDTSDVDLQDEVTPAAGGDVTVVTRYAALVAAVGNLDGQEVADRTIVHAWRDEQGELRMFYPTWDPGCNGRANIAGSGGWKDTATGESGGPVKMALIAAENFPRNQDATGSDFFRGVRLLREKYGFDLPVYIPAAGSTRSDGSEYDQTPGWALRKAAVAFGLIYEREFEERTSDDGSTYEALPAPVYNLTLEKLNEAGVDHGRNSLGDGRIAKSYLRRKEDEDGETDDADEAVAELLSAL